MNITEMPEIFGVILGLETEPTSVLITLIGIGVISLCLALLNISKVGLVVVNISWLVFCTYMGWFPVWVFIIIAVIASVMVAQKANELISGD